MAVNTENALESRGIAVNPVNTLRFLLEPALNSILDSTRQALGKEKLPPCSTNELQMVIATLFMRFSLNLSIKLEPFPKTSIRLK